MSDFLLELRSEEIPARMQAGARASLEKLFREQMGAAGVAAGDITVWSTPRRLALIARGLPDATQAVSEELKGPKTGAPPQALEGFLRKTGLTRDQLTTRDGVWFAVTEKPGRATREVLAEAIPAIVRAFPWPKSQRWGAQSISTESLRWVRPLSGIVAILGEELVECEVGGVTSSYASRGHRFHHPGEITFDGANDYQDKLRACHVLVDHGERQDLIRAKAAEAASAAGLTLVEDEGLVIENAGLTEWPVPLLGRFDEAYLEVPPEVIQLTARTNQKYFVCEQDGKLANAFVCTANIEASDGGLGVVAGNRKVLAARLSDARFFWEQDRKKTLEEHARGLERITFHEKLGTVADKVERVAKLARRLVEANATIPTENTDLLLDTDIPTAELAQIAENGARLAKADLVTEMVGEFPELQGLMGGYYAKAEGIPDAVADAIQGHYGTPLRPASVAVALADKLDTIEKFFQINEKPTGSKDPFALRRAAIQSLQMIMRGLQLDLRQFVSDDVIDFIIERWMAQNKAAGGRPDLIAAVRAATIDGNLYRLGLRMRALEAFVATPDGVNLLAGYKRAANILKKEGVTAAVDEVRAPHDGEEDPFAMVDDPDVAYAMRERLGLQNTLSYTPEPAEKALMDSLATAGPRAAAAVEAEDFAGAMAALATLRAPIDAFFDNVTVNDADNDKRKARLALLARFRDAVHGVADFSRIEG